MRIAELQTPALLVERSLLDASLDAMSAALPGRRLRPHVKAFLAAVTGGVLEAVIDVEVGLPRCCCAPEDAGRLADLARRQGLEVRGTARTTGNCHPRPLASGV